MAVSLLSVHEMKLSGTAKRLSDEASAQTCHFS